MAEHRINQDLKVMDQLGETLLITPDATISGAVAQTGIVTFTAANTHSGAETHSGVETHSGAETHAGAETHTGAERFTSIGPTAAVAANGDTLAVTQALHAGGVIQFGKTTGTVCTLPAATGTGDVYTFVVGTAATSNANIVKVANATDVMNGSVAYQQDTDSAGTLKMWLAAVNDDTINLAGAAGTGGIAGATIVCRDYKSGFWACQVHASSGGGAEVTPFAATVS